jgi:hypothetical protein
MKKQKPTRRKFYRHLAEPPIGSQYRDIAAKIEGGMEPRRTSRPRKPHRHISRGKGVAKKKRKSDPIWCFIIFTIGIFLITLMT